MPIIKNVLVETALEAAIGAAKGHAEDLRTYLELQATILVDGAANLVRDRIAGAIDDEDARFAWSQIIDAEEASRRAMRFTIKVAIQDAINAALGVVRGAANQAIGFKLL